MTRVILGGRRKDQYLVVPHRMDALFPHRQKRFAAPVDDVPKLVRRQAFGLGEFIRVLTDV